MCLSAQNFHVVAIKSCFSVLLLALATDRDQSSYCIINSGSEGVGTQVKVGLIFSDEIMNCVMWSESASARTAVRHSSYLGRFEESLLGRAGLVLGEGGILAHREGVSKEKACSAWGWSPLAGCGICRCECCSSGSQNGVKAFSFSCVPACLMLYGCLAARDGPDVDSSFLLHRPLFPCLYLKTDKILGRSVPLEVWVTAVGDVWKKIQA